MNEKGTVVAREGELVELPQVDAKANAGTHDDPYIAAGITFDECYPYVPTV